MLISEKTKKVLHELGLTEYEIRAYLGLIRGGVMTASEISARGNVPYSKIYETLNSLEKKGWIKTKRGRPHHYSPRSPSESVEAVKLQLQQTVKSWEQAILKELQPVFERTEIREKPDIWILRGDVNLPAKLREILDKAKNELMIAVPSLATPLLQETLEMLTHMGHSDARILFLASKGIERSIMKEFTELVDVRVRDHMFGGGAIADGMEALLFFGARKPDLVIWSNHVGLVRIAGDYFEYLWKTAENVDVRS